MILTIVDRASAGEGKSKPKKPKIEEKFPLKYVVRGLEGEELAQSELTVIKGLKVKILRKLIEEELGLKGKPIIKIFFKGAELLDDKISVEQAGLTEAGSSVDVEVGFKVTVDVHGKGKDYSVSVDVRLEEPIEVLKERVHFFKMFTQRRHVLLDKATETPLQDFSKSFKELGYSEGASLILKEPKTGPSRHELMQLN